MCIADYRSEGAEKLPSLSPTIEIRTSVMDALKNQLDETGKMIQSATRQFFDINFLPREILAQAFGELQP